MRSYRLILATFNQYIVSPKQIKQVHLYHMTERMETRCLSRCPRSGSCLPSILTTKPSVEQLEEMGKWMALKSESICGTQASPFPKLAWGRRTQKKHDNCSTLNLHD